MSFIIIGVSPVTLAAKTKTPSISSIPLISVSNCETTCSLTCAPPESEPLLGARESISSKKIMHGATCFALLKTSRICCSDSPTHFESNSGPFIAIKFTPASFATAFAIIVFPQPGGPKSKIPRGGFIPIFLKLSGFFRGHSTASFKASFTFSSPPTSAHFTFGISISTSRIAEGWTFLKANSKSSKVTFNFSKTSFGISSSSFRF